MEFLQKPPAWLGEALPPAVRDVLENGGWPALLAVAGLLVLLLLWLLARPFLRRRPPPAAEQEAFREDLSALGPLPPGTGDRRLTVDGLPVRLRLVVLAPGGTGFRIEPGDVKGLLDRVVPDLGAIADQDRPRVRLLPGQLSYEGFGNVFHRGTPVPEGEGEPSRWVLVAGRARLGGRSILVGLALEALRPTTLGRMTLEPHAWATVLRVKVRD